MRSNSTTNTVWLPFAGSMLAVWMSAYLHPNLPVLPIMLLLLLRMVQILRVKRELREGLILVFCALLELCAMYVMACIAFLATIGPLND